MGQMWREVTCDAHPEHVQGNGPEQDYFSRFFADAPWHHIDVEYNYQIHHVPFALENSLRTRGFAAACPDYAAAEDSSFLAPRLKMPVEQVRNVHFSGELKFWDFFLSGRDLKEKDTELAEYFLCESLRCYKRWFKMEEPADDYDDFACQRKPDGALQYADGSDAMPLVN